MSKTVLSIGQCSADHASISRLLQTKFQAYIKTADSIEEAFKHSHNSSIDLILVNRIFDLTGEEGLNFIRDHLAGPAKLIPVILISNYADAQDSAVALGAKRGFGKAALNSPETEKILREFLS
jgi:response regulator RpfG family c-di-GMP phosphodiesterase